MKNLSTRKRDLKGAELLIQGVVQGVGFRPFVYNLANRLHVSGTVTNTSVGVFIKAAASDADLASFIHLLKHEAPPLARITSIEVRQYSEEIDWEDFSILSSVSQNSSSAIIPPDIALCPDCLEELLDKKDKRFHYPFINCTNCGPRFTIVNTIPYDRPKTSMDVFPMCHSCNDEYVDPANRRFHAQPNACRKCGPELSWHAGDGKKIDHCDPVQETISVINEGKVVAIRGLGGFHLTVDGCSDKAVKLLRDRKGRKSKPLAIMVANIETAKKFCHLSKKEEEILLSPEHPILLLPKRTVAGLALNLAPSMNDIGIVLPYTPLHHLLFQVDTCPDALVMTSGNVSGDPICTGNHQAIEELGHIADYFLLHNREIVTRVDDSVSKQIQGEVRSFRRSRGYVPSPFLLPYNLPPILACGAGLKNTFCLGRNNFAFPSQHIGDLFTVKNYEFFLESIEHFKRVFDVEPEVVACDIHPDYMSSQYAQELSLPLFPVQHHHAHAVAVMVENDLQEEVLAVVLDGTGFGTDGTIWGGEILLNDLTGYQRMGHLEQLSLPGGDAATNEPWRMGLSALYHTYGHKGLEEKKLPPLLKSIAPNQKEIVGAMLEKGFNSPFTSSCGRLFDAAAALLGLQDVSHFEGQAAMKLEALAQKALSTNWKAALLAEFATKDFSSHRPNNGKWEIVTSRFVTMIMDGLSGKQTKRSLALQLHFELIHSICKLIEQLSAHTGIRKIVLSGGCMQNQILLEGLFHILEKYNFKVYTGKNIPVNDGGISLGQAIIGGLNHVSRNTHAGNSN